MEEKLIKELKDKYGAISALEVLEVDTTLIVKPIDRPTYVLAQKWLQKGDDLNAAEVIIKSITVHGDVDKVCENLKALQSLSEPLAELLEVKSSKLKKI